MSVIFGKTTTAKWKGAANEYFVANELRKKLPNDKYKIIDNLYIKLGEKIHTTQIDHIIVSSYGIFCIETKGNSGSIYGSPKAKYWKSYLKGIGYEFYNPLKQNQAHKFAIEKLLTQQGISANVECFISFPTATKLRLGGAKNVGTTAEVISMIKEKKHILLDRQQVDTVFGLLKSNNLISRETIKQHKYEITNNR